MSPSLPYLTILLLDRALPETPRRKPCPCAPHHSLSHSLFLLRFPNQFVSPQAGPPVHDTLFPTITLNSHSPAVKTQHGTPSKLSLPTTPPTGPRHGVVSWSARDAPPRPARYSPAFVAARRMCCHGWRVVICAQPPCMFSETQSDLRRV